MIRPSLPDGLQFSTSTGELLSVVDFSTCYAQPALAGAGEVSGTTTTPVFNLTTYLVTGTAKWQERSI